MILRRAIRWMYVRAFPKIKRSRFQSRMIRHTVPSQLIIAHFRKGEHLMRVAFIGLCTMRSPMVRNLLSAGFDLTVFNRTSSKSKELVQLGVTVAESPQMAARMVEVVCICVSDPDAVREVLLGEQGAFAGAKPGSLFINLGTVDPTTSRDLADACGIAGCGFVDAPVSGGVAGAIGGTLTIMAVSYTHLTLPTIYSV